MARRASAKKKAPTKPAKKAPRSSASKAKPAPEKAEPKKAGRRRLEVGPSNAEVIETTLQRAIDDTIEHADLVKISDGGQALDDPDAIIIAKHGQLYRVKRPAPEPRRKGASRSDRQ
jgi:hypothetical protein